MATVEEINRRKIPWKVLRAIELAGNRAMIREIDRQIRLCTDKDVRDTMKMFRLMVANQPNEGDFADLRA